MNRFKRIHKAWTRTIAIMLIGVFSLSNIVFAIADNTVHEKLSPPISFQLEEFENSYTVAAICRSIEQCVALDNEKAIDNICSWVHKSPNSDVQITLGIHEVIIDIPGEGLAVRYFVPGKTQVVTPYNDVVRLRTKVINAGLCRQVIHRVKAIFYKQSSGVNLWEDKRIIELARDVEKNGLIGNEHFVKTTDVLPKSDEPSAKVIGIYEHTETGLRVVMKTGGSHFDTRDLPFCCPTFYTQEAAATRGEEKFSGQIKEMPHAELYLTPFGYQRIEDLSKDQITSETLNAIRRAIMSSFRQGEIVFNNEDGHWYRGISHGHIHGGNVLVKINEHGQLEDIKIIDWKKIAPAILPDDIADFIRGERNDLKNSNFEEVGRPDKEGRMRRDGLEGFDFAEINKGRTERLDMSGACFDRAWADWVNFEGTILRNTSFDNTFLFGANFKRADLRGAYITRARYADFSYADLRGTTFNVSKWGITSANFSYADFRDADIGDTDFDEAILVGTKFNLDKADQFEEKGYVVIREKGHCLVTSPNQAIETILDVLQIFVERSGDREQLFYHFDSELEPLIRGTVRSSRDNLMIQRWKDNAKRFHSTIVNTLVDSLPVEIYWNETDKKKFIDLHKLHNTENAKMNRVLSTRLKLVLTEMLDNAYDAITSCYDPEIMPEGPGREYRGIITTSFKIEDGHFVITVTDNGLGKNAARTDRKKTERVLYGGRMGKGLNIVGRIAGLVGGSFDLDLGDSKGGRTTATFKIPIEKLKLETGVVTTTPPLSKVANSSRYLDYTTQNKDLFSDILGAEKPPVLLRVPVEAIENIGRDNIQTFLEAFAQAPNAYVELFYMSGIGEEVSANIYEALGVNEKTLPDRFERNRQNTVTLFPAMKGENLTDVTIRTRLGNLNMKPTDTIISPIGLQYDLAGLVRSTVLGLRIMGFARELAENEDLATDSEFLGRIQVATMEIYKQVCDPSDRTELAGLTPQDIISLATGSTINDIIGPLRKLIKLLPITPVDAEELRHIYEHAREVLLAA